MSTSQHWNEETLAVSLGRPAHVTGAPVNYPIAVSTTFVAGDNAHGYIREGTVGTEALEQVIGALEHGHATVFSSGIATVSAVVDLLPAHAIVVVANHAYPGTVKRLREFHTVERIVLREVLVSDTDAVIAASEGAALVWLETPTNPLMEVADIRAIVAAAKKSGALVAVDNTFMSPLRQRPLDLGADISMHSATKSISGHSDVLMGVLTAKDPELAEKIRVRRTMSGANPGALECFLALRGLRTLAIRTDRAEANAQVIAEKLAAHPRVEQVLYVGLPTDPGHARHKSQASGAGAVVCFIPKGDVDKTELICESTQLWTHATSLGGVESTLERRRRWPAESPDTHESLIRLSVGIENVDDLWADLDQALTRALGK